LKQQGFYVFCPLILKTTKKNNKFLNHKIPLFPGYLFLGAPIEPVPWNTINGTRGVSKAVTLDGLYHPVNTKIIEGLKYRCDQDSVIQQLDSIIPGDRVKIEQGPFSDFICTVEEIADNRRAWILIDLLQKQTRAEISLTELSKIN